jgi:hypothetical protein
MRGGRKRWDDKLAAAKTEELVRGQVIQVIDEALQQGQDVHTGIGMYSDLLLGLP